MPEIRESVLRHPSLVLSAAPGAGKTTRLPPELLKITNKAVWVLEPRRIAAIAAASRIAEENGWELGREVGYQVRFENKSSRETKLLFLTEALLLRKLLRDPDLSEVGCVVLDEFHERSLHVDLALGALRELQELARPDLKIVVMSATLNTEPLARYLGGAPVVEVPGKIFPLEIRYEAKSQLIRCGPDFTERMHRLVLTALKENLEGDLLCFLPGRGEIARLETALRETAEERGLAVYPLHGQLSLTEQKLALAPAAGRRKIILATNVAESSLTVEGVRIVVDSGLARISQMHLRTGFTSLDLVRISKASATQRAGRAARRGPGVVYRAWMPYDELSMPDFEPAEIARSDLTESLLLLSALGVRNFESFTWFEAPPPRALEQARNFLVAIGAIQIDGALTELGRQLRELPVHPRISQLLFAGKAKGLGRFACELAALLSEASGRIPPGAFAQENDLFLRWEAWKRTRHQSITRAADQLRTLLGAEGENGAAHQEEEMPALLLEAYGDRLCRRRRANEPQAKMAGGRGVKLHPDSTVRQSEFFLALELSEGRDAAETLVFQAVGIPVDLVEKAILPRALPAQRLEWDEVKQRFFMVETKEWQGLSVGKEHRRPADANEVEGQLVPLLVARWDQLLAANEGLAHWFARLRFLAASGGKWPLPSEGQVREALDLAAYGERSLSSVYEKNLVPFFESALSPEHREALARECPSFWTVPTGSKMRIQYSEEQGPYVEVRLQELFGLKEAPKIAGRPLTLFLLAPNFRPVQVTRDLPSFWQNGYPEVRKEMRARYPKHSWPEDPLTAAPQAKGRPRNTSSGEGTGI
jgi:ATP-dependent helicase HrpB